MLGDYIARSVAEQHRTAIVDPRHPLARHIARVGERLCELNGLPPHRYVLVNSPDLNAFVVPGRTVFVFLGLLPVLENESSLAMVLGHEMAHCLAGHGVDAMAVTLPVTWIAETMAGALGEAMISVAFTLRASRANEYEADVVGLHLMTTACYDRREGIAAFQRLQVATQEESSAVDWLLTHPNWDKRVKALQSLMEAPSVVEAQRVGRQRREQFMQHHGLDHSQPPSAATSFWRGTPSPSPASPSLLSRLVLAASHPPSSAQSDEPE